MPCCGTSRCQLRNAVREVLQEKLIKPLERLPGVMRGSEISLEFRDDLTQRTAYPSGIVATIADTACGYAAFSLCSDARAYSRVQDKLLSPARGIIAGTWESDRRANFPVCRNVSL